MRKLAKSSKIPKFDPFMTFEPWQMTFRVIQSNPVHQHPHWEAPWQHLTFLTYKIDIQDDSTKSTFLQYIGTFLTNLHAKEEQKLSNRFWEINILSEKLTTDDDGRIGISKAPLLSGWRS